MTTTRHLALLPALLTLVGLTSCSSGGSDAPPIDITGYYKVWLQVGTSPETGPLAAYFSSTNGVVDGPSLTGTVAGSSFVISQVLPGITLDLTGAMTGPDNGNGTLRVAGFNTTGSFRLERYAPAGTLSVTGNVGGQPTGVASTTAIGLRDYTDEAKTNLEVVSVLSTATDLRFEISFAPAGLAVGTLTPGTDVNVVVAYTSDALINEYNGTGGTVTITKYDNTGLTGTYTISLDSGDTVTGAFDVAFDLEAY